MNCGRKRQKKDAWVKVSRYTNLKYQVEILFVLGRKLSEKKIDSVTDYTVTQWDLEWNDWNSRSVPIVLIAWYSQFAMHSVHKCGYVKDLKPIGIVLRQR